MILIRNNIVFNNYNKVRESNGSILDIHYSPSCGNSTNSNSCLCVCIDIV